MKVVVDTNIIFSGLLNPVGSISDILLNSNLKIDFYSPSFMLQELDNHKEKLINFASYSGKEYDFLHQLLLKKINLIDIESIQQSTFRLARELTNEIDEFDIPFIALSLEMEALLWTGDKKLMKGLRAKGIKWIFSTKMTDLRDELG